MRETFSETVEKAVNTLSTEQADVPELTIPAEEAEGDFYYEQLNGSEQIVYRELLQGVREMEDCITIHAGRDEHPEKVYEYLLYDPPGTFLVCGKFSDDSVMRSILCSIRNIHVCMRNGSRGRARLMQLYQTV